MFVTKVQITVLWVRVWKYMEVWKYIIEGWFVVLCRLLYPYGINCTDIAVLTLKVLQLK